MAWVYFAVCLIFGILGVHKFMEKKTGMGFLYLFTGGLFCFGWIYDCIKYFKAAMSGQTVKGGKIRKTLDPNEPLPVVPSCNVPLEKDETCHYYSDAQFVKIKNVVVGYSGGNNGVSIRIAKGISYHVGATKAQPIRSNVQEKYPGMLTITNKRIIFSGSKGAFDKKFTSLSSITPHDDGISFQFGEKLFPLMTDDGDYIYQIIARIINSNDE